jgi:hypothetical protein
MNAAVNRHFRFRLVALQNGLINQVMRLLSQAGAIGDRDARVFRTETAFEPLRGTR